MKLTTVLEALQKLAPLELAADWDNVGLLIEPEPAIDVRRILLTIDLTARVLDEALARKANVIIAYHPPIFSGLKRLTQASGKERAVLEAIKNRIAVFSPHTALDAAAGGVNDWLADGLGSGRRSAILPALPSHRKKHAAREILGQGRLVKLQRPVGMSALVDRIKRHLAIETVRVALPVGNANTGGNAGSSGPLTGLRVSSVALCAGAGASVLSETHADVLLTGEMRHHDVLAAVDRGSAVILTEHTHSERGYLPHLARRLAALLARERVAERGVEVFVARADIEPLSVA